MSSYILVHICNNIYIESNARICGLVCANKNDKKQIKTIFMYNTFIVTITQNIRVALQQTTHAHIIITIHTMPKQC